MKKVFFILFLLGLNFSGNAQITFNKRMHFGFTSAYTTSVVPTDSCYYVVGVITNGSIRGGILFSKLSLEGDTIFTKSYFRENADLECYNGTLQSQNDTTLWLSGYATGVPNGRDGLAIEFNTEGDTIRTFQYKSTHFEPTVVSSVNMIVENENRFSFLNAVYNEEYGNHRYFCITDSLGNILHDKIFWIEASTGIFGAGFTKVEDEYFFELNFGTGPPSNPIGTQKYLIRLDEEANLIDEKYFPAELVEEEYWQGASQLIHTFDGNIISEATRGYIVENPNGGEYAATKQGFIKYNYDLDTLWMTEMGYEGVETAWNFRVTEAIDSSGYVSCGQTFLNGNWHGHIAKVSPEGDSLWYRIYNYIDWNDHVHEFRDIEPTPDGGYLMCGYNTKTLLLEPYQQGWIVKTDQYGCVVPDCHLIDTSSVSNTNLPKIDLKLYPNPTSDILNIFFRNPNGGTNGVFRIVDEQGRVVRTFESNIAEVTHVLSVSDYVGGVYFLQYLEEGEVLVLKRFLVF